MTSAMAVFIDTTKMGRVACCARRVWMSANPVMVGIAKSVINRAFYTSGSINLKPMIVPHFHFYLDTDFIVKWKEGDKV